MNKKGFVKSFLIIILLLLVLLLYYQTDETKEIVGMLIAGIDVDSIDTGEFTDVVEGSLETPIEVIEEPIEPEPVEDPIENTLVDASEKAHLLVSASGNSNRNILDNLDESQNNTLNETDESNDTVEEDTDNSDEDDED
jgi:hypothetical protein